MKNVLYYLDKYGKKSLHEYPFNEVDSLILSQICYLNLDDFIPSIMDHEQSVSLISYLNDEKNILSLTCNTLSEKENIKLLKKLAKTTRYEGLYMNYILDKFHIDVVQQFYAMTFEFEKFIFIGFRGTDTTFLGWKEDFNLALLNVIPSQVDATDYLNKIGNLTDKNILVGGHSKGGNLSLYATMYCEDSIRNRIKKIFNHDGPGFNKDIYETKEFLEVKDRMIKVTCEQAMVGLLLYHSEEMYFVKAKGFSLLQHNPYNWYITKDGKLRLVKYPTVTARVFEKTVRDFIESTSLIERKRFFELLFICAMEDGYSTLLDIKKHPIKYIMGIKARYKVLSHRRKIFMKLMLKRYKDIWRQNMKYFFTFKRRIGERRLKHNLHEELA